MKDKTFKAKQTRSNIATRKITCSKKVEIVIECFTLVISKPSDFSLSLFLSFRVFTRILFIEQFDIIKNYPANCWRNKVQNAKAVLIKKHSSLSPWYACRVFLPFSLSLFSLSLFFFLNFIFPPFPTNDVITKYLLTRFVNERN